ncbi:MAG: hypothetical protein V3V08_25110, partial [Nannocystaceae bacterium]
MPKHDYFACSAAVVGGALLGAMTGCLQPADDIDDLEGPDGPLQSTHDRGTTLDNGLSFSNG